MVENEKSNSGVRTILIAAGIILAIVVFFVTWSVISSLNSDEKEQKLEFFLYDEDAGPSHVYFIGWEGETYSFEGESDTYKFDIEQDQEYSFELHLKDLSTDELIGLTGTLEVTKEQGILVDIVSNELGNYTIVTRGDHERIVELSIVLLDMDHEVYLYIREFSRTA